METTDEAGLARLAALLSTFTQTLFARVAIAPTEPPRVLPPRDGVALKLRFRKAVGA
jgi:phosphonopyruvate decarboxylase